MRLRHGDAAMISVASGPSSQSRRLSDLHVRQPRPVGEVPQCQRLDQVAVEQKPLQPRHPARLQEPLVAVLADGADLVVAEVERFETLERPRFDEADESRVAEVVAVEVEVAEPGEVRRLGEVGRANGVDGVHERLLVAAERKLREPVELASLGEPLGSFVADRVAGEIEPRQLRPA